MNLFHLCYQTLGKVASRLIGSCNNFEERLQLNHVMTMDLNQTKSKMRVKACLLTKTQKGRTFDYIT